MSRYNENNYITYTWPLFFLTLVLGLVVFPYNVPTATLTLLWSEGKVGGTEWMPLLPRRKKK